MAGGKGPNIRPKMTLAGHMCRWDEDPVYFWRESMDLDPRLNKDLPPSLAAPGQYILEFTPTISGDYKMEISLARRSPSPSPSQPPATGSSAPARQLERSSSTLPRSHARKKKTLHGDARVLYSRRDLLHRICCRPARPSRARPGWPTSRTAPSARTPPWPTARPPPPLKI